LLLYVYGKIKVRGVEEDVMYFFYLWWAIQHSQVGIQANTLQIFSYNGYRSYHFCGLILCL
jgi:hypothetical protein